MRGTLRALTGFGASQLTSTKTAVGKLDALSAHAIRTLEAGRQIEIMRGTALRYKFDATEDALKAGSAAAEAASELLRQAPDAALSDERRRAYNSLKADVSDFQKKRDQLVETTRRLGEARAKLFTVGDDLTAATEKLAAAAEAGRDQSLIRETTALDVRLLKARVANWRFQATNDVNGPATFKDDAEKARNMIAKLEAADLSADERQSLSSVKGALSAQVSAFDNFAENLLKSNDLFSNEITPLAIGMLDAVAGAEASLKKDFLETRLGVGKTIDDTITAQRIIGFLTLVLSVFVAHRVGRSIVRPISDMTAAMARLSSGDVKVDIPSRDRVDEIGAMAKAVEVFKANLVNARQLEAEASRVAQLVQDAFTRLRDAVEAVPEGFV